MLRRIGGGLVRDTGDFIFVSLGRESFYTCKSKLVIMVIISLKKRTSFIKWDDFSPLLVSADRKKNTPKIKVANVDEVNLEPSLESKLLLYLPTINLHCSLGVLSNKLWYPSEIFILNNYLLLY